MATATRPAPATNPAGKTTLYYLQRALDDLDKARVLAEQDARLGIDAAVDRIHSATTQMSSRAQDEAQEWQDRLQHVSDDARRELARIAIRAQRSPEALTELAAEIRGRKRELGG